MVKEIVDTKLFIVSATSNNTGNKVYAVLRPETGDFSFLSIDNLEITDESKASHLTFQKACTILAALNEAQLEVDSNISDGHMWISEWTIERVN